MPVVINSRFTPLTYDEITRPLIEQTQAQEALENAYMEASDQASQIMAQANEQTDPIAYARLKNYSEALQQQAESLMRQGLNRNSRQSLINMRRRYNQDIVPVQNAVTRRNELMEERRKLRLTHPDMLQERDVISLDDLIRNPQMDLGSTLYGSDISKRAAALTSAIGRGRQSVALGQNLDKYTQTILSQSGLSTAEIQAALAGDDSVLDKALSNLYSSTGVDSWSNQAAKDAVRGYIQEGAMNGVGQFSIATQRDAAAARRDQLADQASDRAFRANMSGMIWDPTTKRYIQDPNYTPRTKTATVRTSNGDVISIESVGVHSKKYGTIYKGTDGNFYRKNGTSYTKIDDQDDAFNEFKNGTSSHDKPDSKTTTNWIADHGGEVAAFDANEEYGTESMSHFNDVLSNADFLKDDGTWGDDVEELSISDKKIPNKVRAKLQEARDNSGLSDDDFTIIRVDRTWPIDNDYFLVTKRSLEGYKQNILSMRGVLSDNESTDGLDE